MAEKTMTHDEKIEKVRALIKGIDICMLTTVEADGSLHSRPMSTQQVEFDGDVWFFTDKETEKARNIAAQPQVNIAYKHDDTFVSVSGNATISQDRAKMKELWSDILKAWFPKGLEDPSLALIHVSVQSAEYWDNPDGKIMTMLSFVKSVVTGQSMESGENEQISMK